MIWNEWVISLIIAGAILLISIPLLFWIRYGKNGKKAFAHENVFKKENQIKELEKAIIQQERIISDWDPNEDGDLVLKKAKKQLIGLQKQLKNKKEK